MSLSGKVAVVTGGASGLGVAFADCLLRRGALVALLDIGDGTAVSKRFNDQYGSGRTKFLKVDVTAFGDVETAFDTIKRTLGPIDIVFNNAGITGDNFEDYERVIAINLTAVIAGTKLAIKHMEGRGGVIINTASLGGFFAMPFGPVYAATKAGVIHFSRSLAHLSGEGIRVNALCPGFTDTPLVQSEKEVLEEHLKTSGGLLTAEHVAEEAMQLVEGDAAGGALVIEKKYGTWNEKYHPRRVFPSKL